MASSQTSEPKKRSASTDLNSDEVKQIADTHYHLSMELFTDYEISGQIDKLNNAIAHLHLAVGAGAKSPHYAMFLGSLGTAYGYLYDAQGAMRDLDESIAYSKQAVDTFDNGRVPPGHLSNLAINFNDRYARSKQIDDLDKAIQYTLRAVDETSESDAMMARRLTTCGNVYQERFLALGQMDDLKECLRFKRRAKSLVSGNHPHRAMILNNLATALAQLSNHSSDASLLSEAIQVQQQAIACTDSELPTYGKRQNLLASLLLGRFHKTNDDQDWDAALKAFRAALSSSNNMPLNRLVSGNMVAHFHALKKEWQEAADVLEQTLSVMSQIVPRTNTREDMAYTLRNTFGLSPFAVSVFIKTNKKQFEVVQDLESSRGFISSLMIDNQHEVSSLKTQQPELWLAYDECRKRVRMARQRQIKRLERASVQKERAIAVLDNPESHDARSENAHSGSEQLQSLYLLIDQLRSEIRSCPGFERFLLSPTESDLLDLAREGPLVSFNVSSLSSEAIIVSSLGIRIIEMPKLTLRDCRRWAASFAGNSNPSRRDASVIEDEEEGDDHLDCTTNNPVDDMMTLWEVAVKPILQELSLLNFEPVEALHLRPRIWWVGGGIMGLVPLHAAGIHSAGSTDNTLSHVISSYAPTFKALQYVQQKSSALILAGNQDVLAVSMPDTPGGYSHLNVLDEVEAMEANTQSWATVNHLQNPGKHEVLQALSHCALAHFACHGIADPVQPVKSALILGTVREERLTIEDLDTVDLNKSQIIYLSACSTAETKVQNLADESIHLASTFQLAGFQHVVGTMWGADDSIAVATAGEFYQALSTHRATKQAGVAQSLHVAMLHAREKDPLNISGWGPFVHFGP